VERRKFFGEKDIVEEEMKVEVSQLEILKIG
jgi:hypothetical protein